MVKNNKFFSDPVYIFWTGGYDSTFRLCQLLLIEKVKVQPIYISDPYLDNKKTSKTRRKNHNQEYDSMDKIKIKLNKDYPETKNLLLPTIDIDNIKIDNEISETMKQLKKRKYVRREVCQYGGMAQVTKDLDQYVELCAEIGGYFHKRVHKKLKCYGKECNYKDCLVKDTKALDKEDQCLKAFNKLVLPLIAYTKKDMYDIALHNGFNHILDMTWSCWYPKNNKACGRCIMCRDRKKMTENAIEHFSNIDSSGNYVVNNKKNNNVRICLFIVLFLLIIVLLNLKKY